jgi:hypothetical protein
VGVLASSSAVALTAWSTCLRRKRELVAGFIRARDSSTLADANSVRKSFNEMFVPEISRMILGS